MEQGKFTADFGKTADDYARHRAGYPDWLFERLMRRGLVRPGMHRSTSPPAPATWRAVSRSAGSPSLGWIFLPA